MAIVDGKDFLDPSNLVLDSYRLARMVLESGFEPTFMIGIWRGGTPIGIAVQEYLKAHGIETDHLAIRTSGYKDGIDKQEETVKVYGLEYIIEHANHNDRLLIVDDVWDRGRSITAVKSELRRQMRMNLPQDIRVATIHYKPRRNQVKETPDYFLYETDAWLIYPHELCCLTLEEIRAGKGAQIADLMIFDRFQGKE